MRYFSLLLVCWSSIGFGNCIIGLSKYYNTAVPIEQIRKHSVRKDNEFIRLLAIVYGIESGYSADAISPAGACGIGQMLLSTAKEAARELGDPVPTHKSLLEIETNIRLSSHFMGQLLDRFGNNQAAALIAYNAGPSWVSRFKRSGRLPAETTAYLSRYFYLQQEYCK